ncbi:hypothetical protein BROUX41_003018 [Berkeleyomyces rouxiae]|uniref:uncharacterized protein n=1 Tax=Berkeleyomyces rouxiae TaxID=2035830 RepID=UPI003B78CCDF
MLDRTPSRRLSMQTIDSAAMSTVPHSEADLVDISNSPSPVLSIASTRGTTTATMTDTHDVQGHGRICRSSTSGLGISQRNIHKSPYRLDHSHDDPPEVILSEELVQDCFQRHTPKLDSVPSINPSNIDTLLCHDRPSSTGSSTEATTLRHLAHTVRLEAQTKQQCSIERARLQRRLIANALDMRFLRSAAMSQRSFDSFFRSENTEAFADLYAAVRNLQSSVSKYRNFGGGDTNHISPQAETTSSLSIDTGTSNVASAIPFLECVHPSTRQAFLGFISRIRTDPEYLAELLCSLTSNELLALTKASKGPEDTSSVLPQQSKPPPSRNTGRATRRPGLQALAAIDRMVSLHRHDPLYTIMYTCFPDNSVPGHAENIRRLNIWANACAKLITAKTGLEPVLVSIMNAWISTCHWPGKSNIEWYLMRILEDGAFILDRAEDQQGTRFNLRHWTPKDDVVAQEFYEKAVSDLFDIVDDAQGAGIPGSFLELVNEILRRVDPTVFDCTRCFFISRWLFQNLLLDIVIHPEGYGIMTDYHITTYGREKILRQVGLRALGYVTSSFDVQNSETTIPLCVRQHITNITNRFHGGRISSERAAATTITQLHPACPAAVNLDETYPYLVVSPSDLITMVNALFPDRSFTTLGTSTGRRPTSALASGSSGFLRSPVNFNMFGSMPNSNTAPLSSSKGSPTPSSLTDPPALNATGTGVPPTEDLASSPSDIPLPAATDSIFTSTKDLKDQGVTLRRAIQNLKETASPESVQGNLHPCADQWAVIFISPCGNRLSTRMACESDLGLDGSLRGNPNHTKGGEDKNDNRGNVEATITPSSTFPNVHGAAIKAAVMKLTTKYEVPNTTQPSNVTPSLGRSPETLESYQFVLPKQALPQIPNPQQYHGITDSKEPLLVQMLRAAVHRSDSEGDFSSSMLYYNGLQQLLTTGETLINSKIDQLLLGLLEGPRADLLRSTSAIDQFRSWDAWAAQVHDHHVLRIKLTLQRLRALRDKMWYTSDVVNSAPYTHSRSICMALKAMERPQRFDYRSRINSTSLYDSTYIHLAEFQMLDLLAASDYHGGPLKLSDDQVEQTVAWLKSHSIENICKGEERIHRLCLEVDACVRKLIGETLTDAPILWSSELFTHDWDILDGNAKQTDNFSCSQYNTPPILASSHHNIFPQPDRCLFRSGSSNPGNRHQLQPQNTSGHGTKMSKFGLLNIPSTTAKASTSFSAASDPTTSWSPFQKPSSKLTGAAYASSTSSTSTTNVFSTPTNPQPQSYLSSARASFSGRSKREPVSTEVLVSQRPPISQEKLQFLEEFKRKLVGLLLSDLGNLVYARGSETDGWFAEVGQKCIEDKDEAIKTTSQKSQQWVSNTDPGLVSDIRPTSMTDTMLQFSFNSAYKHLLQMFSVHPNPYIKLKILRKMSKLVVASVSTIDKTAKDTPSATEQDHKESTPKVTPSTSLQLHLQALINIFRDPGLRPKTLFRDLQFIASAVPSNDLKAQEDGLCFWDFAAAAIRLKMQASSTMLRIAEDIIQADIRDPNPTRPACPDGKAPSTSYKPSGMAEAVRMVVIAAREGFEPAAQRELALLYMARPNLLGRVLIPLSKPREVFRQALMDVYGSSATTSSSGGPTSDSLSGVSGAPGGSSPLASATVGDTHTGVGDTGAPGKSPGEQSTEADKRAKVENMHALCLAVHWMEAAQLGGDKLANDFMNQGIEDLA